MRKRESSNCDKGTHDRLLIINIHCKNPLLWAEFVPSADGLHHARASWELHLLHASTIRTWTDALAIKQYNFHSPQEGSPNYPSFRTKSHTPRPRR